MFLNFANFYQRFINRYLQITISLIDMLRNIQTDVKKEFFISTDDATTTFRRLKNVFQSTVILIHFDSKLFIRLKIDVFDHNVIDIIFQLQTNNQCYFVTFYAHKIIFAECNYETHDHNLLTIIMCFKH